MWAYNIHCTYILCPVCSVSVKETLVCLAASHLSSLHYLQLAFLSVTLSCLVPLYACIICHTVTCLQVQAEMEAIHHFSPPPKKLTHTHFHHHSHPHDPSAPCVKLYIRFPLPPVAFSWSLFLSPFLDNRRNAIGCHRCRGRSRYFYKLNCKCFISFPFLFIHSQTLGHRHLSIRHRTWKQV